MFHRRSESFRSLKRFRMEKPAVQRLAEPFASANRFGIPKRMQMKKNAGGGMCGWTEMVQMDVCSWSWTCVAGSAKLIGFNVPGNMHFSSIYIVFLAVSRNDLLADIYLNLAT